MHFSSMKVDSMGCHCSCVQSDTESKYITVKNNYAEPDGQVTALPVSPEQETGADVVQRKGQREVISGISNLTYTNEEDHTTITSRGDSNPSPTSYSEYTDSKDNHHRKAVRTYSSSGYGGDSNPSPTSYSEYTDSKDNHHRKAVRTHSSSGYGGSDVSRQSSFELTTYVSNSNNGLKVDAIHERLSSIQSCSEVSCQSSLESITDVSNMNNSLKVDVIHKLPNSIKSSSTENDSRSSAADSTSIHVPRPVKKKGMNGYFPHKSKLKLPHSDCLQRNFRYVKDELTDTADVVDHLIQAGDLDDDDHDEIQTAKPRRKRVDVLLRKLLTSTPAAYEHFVESLREIGRQDMVDVLSDDNIRITDLVPVIQDDAPGKDALLHDKDDFLVRELEPDFILDFFFQNGTFSLDDYKSVSVINTRKQKVKKLTKLIRKKLPWGYYDLLYALGMTQTYHIIEELVLPYQGDERLNMTCGCSELTDVCCGAASGKFMMNEYALDNSEIKIEVCLSTKNGQRLSELEMRINDHLNDSEGDDIREYLLENAKCGFAEANMGSIIILLRPYSSTSTNKIREFCKRGCIRPLIMKILKAKELLPHIPEGEIIIDVKVENFGHYEKKLEGLKENVGQNERQQTDTVEMVRRNRSYLLEELDLFRVVKTSLDKKIFTDSEIQKINECVGKGRRKTTEMFIECLLQKGHVGCDHFLEVLKRTRQTTILQHLQGKNALSGQLGSLKDNLVEHFQTVADEIDPMDFEEIFLEREIFSRQYFHNLSEKFSRNRRNRAIYFITTILDQGASALKAFIDGLVQEGHDQLAKMLCDTTIKRGNNHTLEEYDLAADFEIEEVSVEEMKSQGAVFTGRIEVIVRLATSLQKQVIEKTDVGSSDEIYSNERDNNDDEGLEVTEDLSDHHHKKKKHGRCKRATRPKTLPAQTCEGGNGIEGSKPTQKIKKASTFPKHRKNDASNVDDKSPLSPGDSGYVGSSSSKQKLAQAF